MVVPMLDADSCYRALAAKDARFDGCFFVGVATTGIYCRPVCRARTPRRDRCTFYRTAAEAERAAFRACFRCRPELAPGLGRASAVSRLAAQAAERIDAGYLNEGSVDGLAEELGVTGRHLRRAVQAELGVSPVHLAQVRRLALAKQLLQDTELPLTEVAFASGFASVRRFNAAFQRGFGRPPSTLRRELDGPRRQRVDHATPRAGITLRLDYRPPLDWEPLLAFLSARAIPGVERVSGGRYARSVAIDARRGTVVVARDPRRDALVAEVSLSLAPALMAVSARLRRLFDLDAQPTAIRDHLAKDATLAPLLARRPGLRLPGAFDPFETSARAILGQQVSVAAATSLSGRLAAAVGEPLASAEQGLTLVFPSAERVARAGEAAIAELGIPRARARALVALAEAHRAGLGRATDPDEAREELLALPGVGPWTAEYLAMRVLGWPDAFPASDLALRRALGGLNVLDAKAAEARAEPWRPFRSYAAMHLWTRAAESSPRPNAASGPRERDLSSEER